MSEEYKYSVEEIRKSFWDAFHKSGEIWFDNLGNEEECELHTEGHWSSFLDRLQENSMKKIKEKK